MNTLLLVFGASFAAFVTIAVYEWKARKHMFFTVEYCAPASEIRLARFSPGNYTAMSKLIYRSVALQVNDVLYSGDDALRAARALYDCGFYTKGQFEEVENALTTEIRQENIVFGGQFTRDAA